MAVLSAASIDAAAVSKEEVSSVETDMRRLITSTSFSQQAEDAIEEFKDGDEGGSKKEKESSMEEERQKDMAPAKKKSNRSDNKNSSRSKSFSQRMCDPDNTTPKHEDICEDIWYTMCNPDVEMEVDDELCDWLGFTADVDWVENDAEEFEYGMVYKKVDDGKFKKVKEAHEGSGENPNSNKFTSGMCDPEDMKDEHEDICDDIWETVCNPNDETYVDDEYCDWFGFTADVEWYDGEDFDFDNYEVDKMKDLYYDSSDSSEDWAHRKNLRG
jgi:hypothetical protein